MRSVGLVILGWVSAGCSLVLDEPLEFTARLDKDAAVDAAQVVRDAVVLPDRYIPLDRAVDEGLRDAIPPADRGPAPDAAAAPDQAVPDGERPRDASPSPDQAVSPDMALIPPDMARPADQGAADQGAADQGAADQGTDEGVVDLGVGLDRGMRSPPPDRQAP